MLPKSRLKHEIIPQTSAIRHQPSAIFHRSETLTRPLCTHRMLDDSDKFIAPSFIGLAKTIHVCHSL
ncbi:hypothetical protein [uncultured Prevotella sp.]|uniref:hypothetical protein n=1 Tax=uncultured Prevotella sp. TaxID=159272 RepID=UPI0025881A4C|nr:hypothetical protein [uncultured Prevotella sp.]